MSGLGAEFTGVDVNGKKLTSFGYADDIVMTAKTPRDAQDMLDYTTHFPEDEWYESLTNKCRSLVFLAVPSKKKTYVGRAQCFSVDDSPIPSVVVNDMFSYLGEKVLTTGINEQHAIPLPLLEILQKLMRGALKPQQKMVILKQQVIPMFISRCQKPTITAKISAEVDKKIRAGVTKILHLPIHCNNTIFYAPGKRSGLGIFSFRENIPRIILKILAAVRSEDTIMAAILPDETKWIVAQRRILRLHEADKATLEEHNMMKLESSFSGGGININTKRVQSFGLGKTM